MYFILGDRLVIVQDRKTKPSEEEFARSACMHVAIMGEAQCMMIEASMLSANDHETSLVMCVYTTSLSHFTFIMAVKISHIFRQIIPFSCLLCVSLLVYTGQSDTVNMVIPNVVCTLVSLCVYIQVLDSRMEPCSSSKQSLGLVA